jgi:glutamate/tyrosine decarboxylase-like PLP-dependent enzyme
VCNEEKLWFHIDGAYGAVGVLDERLGDRFSGMERADSLALDPHKWLSVPVECGCALIRDGALLRDTFSLVPPYVRTEEGKGIGGLPWFSEYGFQQTRGFRALKVWMTIAAAGRDGLRTTIRGHNDLARELADLVRSTPDLELLNEPVLSIVCFRYVPAAGFDANEVNKRIMEAIQSSGTAFVTQAVLGGTFWLRANILHFGTTSEDLRALVDTVIETAGRVVAAPSG